MKSRIPAHDEVELVEKQLFRSLAHDDPPIRARRVAAAALGLGGAALTSATAGAEGAAMTSIAPKAGAFLLVKWVGIGTVAGAMSVGAIQYARPHLSSHSPQPSITAPARAPSTAHEVIGRPSAPEEMARDERPAHDSTTRAPQAMPAPRIAPNRITATRVPLATEAVTEETPLPGPSSTRVTPSELAAEVRLLDEARGALSATDGPRALDALRRYARQFPTGTLNLEAAVLRIEALYMTGASSAAAALGRDFLAAHPTSTHAARVRRLLAEREKP